VRSERGSITVVTAAVIGMVVVVTMGTADIGSALIARSHARQGADAAALAAAQELALPTGRAPAEVAGDYAAHNGATLTACTCAPGSTEALVTVTVPIDLLLLLPGSRVATAQARAVVGPPA
jgi:secretion/DNA translocation related TadE-like protein